MKFKPASIKFFFPLLLLFTGCIIIEIGKWDDNIKLSVRDVEFKAKGDSVTVSTQGDWWWLTDITIGDSTYYGEVLDNAEKDQYTYTKEDITIEKRNKHTLFIKAGENLKQSVRKITIGLEAGDYFDRITIRQKARD